MKTKPFVIAICSIVAAGVITYLTGFVQTPLAHLGVDVVYWGIPLPWMSRVIPTRFNNLVWINLIVDLAFWIMVVLIASMLLYKMTERGSSRS